MSNVFVGALAMAALWFAVTYSRSHELRLGKGKWLLTILVILYCGFVALVGIGFLKEDAGQAALVVSLIMGVPGVIFVVLLKRFVFVS